MNDSRIKIRANRSVGELEVEGPPELVADWWGKLWPEMAGGGGDNGAADASAVVRQRQPVAASAGNTQLPDVFGEFFNEFRSDITDVDKMLIAGAFVQGKEPDRIFRTKSANQLLMDQNIKLTNASECVRRLILTKRAFVVSEGKFRVSSN